MLYLFVAACSLGHYYYYYYTLQNARKRIPTLLLDFSSNLLVTVASLGVTYNIYRLYRREQHAKSGACLGPVQANLEALRSWMTSEGRNFSGRCLGNEGLAERLASG